MKTIEKEMLTMKHTIEVKLPKMFGRKTKAKTEEGTEVKTEVTLDDIKEQIEESVDTNKLKENVLKYGVPIAVGVAGLALGHMKGFNSGVVRGMDGKIIVVK